MQERGENKTEKCCLKIEIKLTSIFSFVLTGGCVHMCITGQYLQ